MLAGGTVQFIEGVRASGSVLGPLESKSIDTNSNNIIECVP